MDINKLNYELYFVDYHEGNLSTEQVAELMVFLEQHPELNAEFESFGGFEELNLDVAFSGKSSLKKEVVSTPNINEQNADEILIADLEGDLSATEQAELNEFLDKNAFYKEDQAIYQKTKLTPPDVSYADKAALKKPRIIPAWMQRVASAAVIAGILWAGWVIFGPSKSYDPRDGIVKNSIEDPAIGLTVRDYFVDIAPKTSNIASINESKASSHTNYVPPKAATKPQLEPENTAQADNLPLPEELAESVSENLSAIEETVELVPEKLDRVEHFKTRSDYISPVKAMTNFLKKRVLKDDSNIISSHLEGVELAHTTLNSFNKIFGTKLFLHPTYDGEGSMISFVVESNTFEIHKKVKRKKKGQQ